ncbi:dTDP-4-amino-4,6-dideoxygalactose transaminase [Nostoc sphaeroides]|uniref:WecE, dTDP-4-amino-4,6-dideoxygalactose transaminase n=1 Tax=Nostoc sphaeroides CCNUC1 TaxID=2653204 RepID=A0A5P8VY72_9NOSO|nr:dTDP-4-amino-4,6-dideoxygalactose transaminase [Nostoc sphaeroides]QFS45337.1 wecE, dTDP-4-amino-4,6-dideoxygalactose transaminase [Nostoc sphaeroides CCNUC1]
MPTPFNKPFATGKEIDYIQQAIKNGHLSGNGMFTKRCQTWLEQTIGCQKALLTHSCTAALEMSAILANLQVGDEVIMPSYTFVSTANAFVLRGVVPVFVDIRPDTLNIDETKIESAITEKTKAIVPVHYAGVSCEMDVIMDIAKFYQLLVIEDNAQGIGSTYKGQPLGSFGNLSALSFHETKNLISGEGGALLVNDPSLIERSEIIWEKGTNRGQFFRGEVDKYTWVDVGSSYLPSELISAFLWSQFEDNEMIMAKRLSIWETYDRAFYELEKMGKVRRPIIPNYCQHNAHLYYLLLNSLQERTDLIHYLKFYKIQSVFHYIPLHSSPAGIHYGRVEGTMKNTNTTSDCLLRLPLWINLDNVDQIVELIQTYFNNK